MLELIITILQQPSRNKEAQELAVKLRSELESKLTSKEIKTAEERAGSRQVEELALRVLANIESP